MKIYSNGKSIEVKRGDIINTVDGSFKFIGKRNDNLFYVRELRYSERAGDFYPVRGEAGLYYWTAGEIYNAVRFGK